MIQESKTVSRSLLWPKTWGPVLRLCPPRPDMLQDLRRLELASAGSSLFEYNRLHDFHNIVQWLKVTVQSLCVVIYIFIHITIP
jgi:hypothetical protein